MKFLFPQFLWALTTLLIPVIIHLFNFQRPKKVFFSNVALLENVRSQTSSIQKLKHFLILLTRLLFLAFLVFAFAQPFLPASSQLALDNDTRAKVFYLDNSYSMQQENENNTLLEEAGSGLFEFAEILSNNEEIYFLDNDFKAQDLYPYSKSGFSDRLSEVAESHSYRTLKDVINRIDQIDFKGKKEIFIISDLQRSTLGDPEEIQLDSNNIYHLIPMKSTDISNIAIDSVWLEKPFVFEDQVNSLNVRLKSYGDRQINNFPVKLFLNEKQSAVSNVNLSKGQGADLKFSLPNIGSITQQGMIQIEESPVYFDNEFFFILRPMNPIKVSVFGVKENPYFKALFQTEDFFNYQFISLENPDFTELNSSDFIVLDGIGNYGNEGRSSFIKNYLIDFLKKGGHLLINPGDDIASFNALLNDFSFSQIRDIASPIVQMISDPDQNNLFFSGVFQRFEKNTDMPDVFPLLKINDFDLIHLRFKDGTPFFGEKSLHQGKVFVFAGNINKSGSNFYRHSIFVPVMYKMVTGSISTSKNELAYHFGRRSINWEMKGARIGESALRLKKDAFEVIPEQRPSSNGIIFNLPNDKLLPGFYSIVLEDSILGDIAINIDKKESDMSFYSAADFLDEIPDGENIILQEDGQMKEFTRNYMETRFGTPLWKYFLICSLIFLSAEVFLLRLL